MLESRLNSPLEAKEATPQRVQWHVAIEVFQGVFRALAAVLAVRLMLLLALCGGFFLATIAMDRQTVISVVVLVAYSALVIGPPAFLDYGRKFSIGGNDGA